MTRPCVDQMICLLHGSSPQNFADLKKELTRQGKSYAAEALAYRAKIAQLALDFIKDGSVVRRSAALSMFPPHHIQILTHSYSRVVMQTLLLAAQHKRISGRSVAPPETCLKFASVCDRSASSRAGVGISYRSFRTFLSHFTASRPLSS